ncbi:zinc-binding dehydrogenase [Streptomyces sp. NPDC006510]|uniref:alcohol dehydrogenase catalytic domain-containing protein n=1 Tax=Streptomyces sp. NPDC006510 TaxID=3155600 RepID=UPI0033AE416D
MPKAYVVTRNGGPEVEALIEQDVPVPGELLVAVRAAGVNPGDRRLRAGYSRPGSEPQPFPTVLGSEVAGVVEGIGPDVEGFAAGDEVFGNPVTGGYAELGGAAVERARTAAVLEEVANLVVTGALRTHVNRSFPLTGTGDALRAVESGHTLGRIVIEVAA